MTTVKKPVILLAVAAAMSMAFAKALVHAETPEPSKVGGQTAILTEAKWQQSGNLASLEYRDESVAPSALSHDEPLCRVSIRNLLPVQRTLKITANCQQSSDSEKTLTLEPMATATVTLPLAFETNQLMPAVTTY